MTVRIILPLKSLFPTSKKHQKKASASCTTFCLYVSLSKNSILYLYKVQREIFSEAGAKVRLFSITTKFFQEKNKKIKKKTDFRRIFAPKRGVKGKKMMIFYLPSHASGFNFEPPLCNWKCRILSGPTVPSVCRARTLLPLKTLGVRILQYTE